MLLGNIKINPQNWVIKANQSIRLGQHNNFDGLSFFLWSFSF